MLQSGSKNKNPIPSCSICKFQYDSYYRIPRVIPKCGHTYCQKCINTTLQTKSNRKIFLCTECQSQTIIRKTAAQDIPKNIGILDIVKSLKKKQFDQSSPHRQNSIDKQSPSKLKYLCKQHVNKELDLICQTCNYQKVCSICVLIGNSHQNHKFVQFIPASKFDLKQVQEVFTIVQDSVKQTILPHSDHNILKKSEQSLISNLVASIKNHFRQNYYKIIQKKQTEIINQCKQIKFEGGINKKIQQIAKHYDLVKIQYSDIFKLNNQKQNSSLQIIEQFIQKCKNLHNQIELFSQHAQKQSQVQFNQISLKINQSTFFRMTQLPFSLKTLLSQKVNMLSPTKCKSSVGEKAPVTKNKNNIDFDLRQSRNSQRPHSKNEVQTKSVDSKIFEEEKKLQGNSKNKSSFLPPKHKIAKPQPKQQNKQDDIIPLLHINSRLNQKKNSTSQNKVASNTQRLNKSSYENVIELKKSVQKINNKLNLSQITKIQSLNDQLTEGQLKIKQVRPSKQIPLNLKAKYSAIIKQITRQSQSQTLQLVGMQINDALIVYVCDYLKTKKLKYSMIKLVKNNLTDEGLSNLLGYLVNDDRTQVLNLTSNQLTVKSLQLIVQMGNKNNFLKTIYLSHNKVSSFNLKQKAQQLENIGIELIL